MKCFFSFVFLIFSSVLFQAQAQILIPGSVFKYDFDKFDWQAFSAKKNVQEYINFMNETFSEVGADYIIVDINSHKTDLIRIEQELELYRRGIKAGISANDMAMAEEAISLHWESVGDMESQLRFWAGLGGSDKGLAVINPIAKEWKDYRQGVWDLYKGDHEAVFNMVEKKDKALYEALGANDEAYAGFISPYMERYAKKMGSLAQEYFHSLELAHEGKAEFNTGDVDYLVKMYSDSFKIHNCFKENFKGWARGAEQRDLEEAIKGRHIRQGLFGMNSFVEAYKNYKKEYGTSFEIDSVAANLFNFTEAPKEVRVRLIDFYRNDIWNNEEFKASDEKTHLRARVNALIGLNFMGALNEEERKVFNWALERGIIINPGGNPDSFFGFAGRLPPEGFHPGKGGDTSY